MNRTSVRAVCVVLALGWGGCGGDPGDMASPPAFSPTVLSDVDIFRLSATDVTNVTTTVPFDWLNSGVVGIVDHSTITTEGQARLVIRSGTGVTVYDRVLLPFESEMTQLGSAGVWAVTLVLTNFSGTLDIRIDKG